MVVVETIVVVIVVAIVVAIGLVDLDPSVLSAVWRSRCNGFRSCLLLVTTTTPCGFRPFTSLQYYRRPGDLVGLDSSNYRRYGEACLMD